MSDANANPPPIPGDLYPFSENAVAIVLRRWETGLLFGANPQICLLLEVRPAGGPSFNAEVMTVMDRAHTALLLPGALVEVKVDPQQPDRVLLAALPGDTGAIDASD